MDSPRVLTGPISDPPQRYMIVPMRYAPTVQDIRQEALSSYPCYQDELGSWLSSLTGVHISKKGISIGGGLAKLPSITLTGKGPPGTVVAPAQVPMPAAAMNLLPAPVAPSSGISETTLLIGAAALVAVLLLRGDRH